jgi:hypothetical protein
MMPTLWRADGWPFCPRCGEDELFCLDMDALEKASQLSTKVDVLNRVMMLRILGGSWSGLRCYRCSPGKPVMLYRPDRGGEAP